MTEGSPASQLLQHQEPDRLFAGSAEPDRSELARLRRDGNSILSRIGNTPLIRLRRIVPSNSPVEIYAKAEWFNPGGSVKDRAALSMLMEAEASGLLTHDRTIIDATSGNTGIAYAMIARVAGYRVELAMPANASPERKQILRAYGVRLIQTDPLSGTDGAQETVRALVASHPEAYFYPDQYNNPANWMGHYRTTAPEIWTQTRGRVTHFVAGLGTTGTFVGTARRLKEFSSRVACVSFGPDRPLHGLEGLKHLPTAMTPGIYDPALADGHMEVATEEAYALTLRLAREEGLFVGFSSGAALAASLRVASNLDSGVVVTLFPDGGARYTTERFWNEGTGG